MFRCWQNLYSGQSGLTSMSNSDNQTVGTACAGPGAAGATVLLLENDEVIAANVVDALFRDGLGAQWCADAEAAEAALEQGGFRVCLVDRALPTVDGLTFVERLRKKRPGMGVIVISALGGLDDRIHGLQAGADDYLAKPFALTELVARVRAQLRRPLPELETRLRYATLDVDLIERTARVDGQAVDLLPREFTLLTYFMRHAEQVVTRDMLLTEVWRYNFLPQTHLIDVHLGKLLGLVPLAALGLGAGTALSFRTVRRLRTMHEAIERIMRGNLSERLPGSGPKDDLDRLTDGLNRMLDEIERFLGEVKSVGDNIAHDLRTPLTRMRMRLESARAAERTPEMMETLIGSCLTDLDYSFGLVTALLRIAEIEAGRRKAGFRGLDLSDVAEEVGEIYAPIAAARDQALTVDAQPGACLLADHDLLIEAVANLVDNAIKFTPPGGAIRIAVTREAGGPVLRVIDSGAGVLRDERGLVLRRFYRADKSRKVPGHGLGLNLVSAIAALHDCQLRIDDGPGGVFTLDCRVQQGPEQRGGGETSLTAPEASRSQGGWLRAGAASPT